MLASELQHQFGDSLTRYLQHKRIAHIGGVPNEYIAPRQVWLLWEMSAYCPFMANANLTGVRT